MNYIRVQLIIEGRVQGVWFRDSTRTQANALGVFGWVRNRPDGTVEALAEGPEKQVNELIAWCHQGPPYADVYRVHETRTQGKGEYKSFDIVF